MESAIVDIFVRVLLPILTLVGGWFAHLIRTKQKKEADILDNVKQILEIQKEYIEDQKKIIDERDDVIWESKNLIKRLEAKLDRKSKSIRKANMCKFTNEGDGCPVLLQEEKNETDEFDCDKCKLKNTQGNDKVSSEDR